MVVVGQNPTPPLPRVPSPSHFIAAESLLGGWVYPPPPSGHVTWVVLKSTLALPRHTEMKLNILLYHLFSTRGQRRIIFTFLMSLSLDQGKIKTDL